jgi:hypothetical protein
MVSHSATISSPFRSNSGAASPAPFSLKNKTMSITQTYYLAHKARAKLSTEASRSDHNLRLLVGHANLLDSLMLELADAERDQESWFNQSVRGATKSEERHVQWADTIAEDEEEDWEADSDSSSDSDDDYEEEEDVEMADVVSLRRVASATVSRIEAYDDMEEDDLEEDYAQLELVRTSSHSNSPPELDHDSDTSEDESMPPSPPTALLTFSEKESKEEIQDDSTFYSEGFYLPPRNPARLISAISVY